MSLGKIKTGIKQATTSEGIPKVILHLIIGFTVGVIADNILEAIVYATSKTGWGRLEVGFKFYIGVDTTSIAYDDLILLGISIVLLFTKKLWFVIGFILGWYISSCAGLYGKLFKPLGAPSP